MNKNILISCLLGLSSSLALGQSNNNGKLDKVEEFTTVTTVPFTMPDGVELNTDLYLPITSDSLTSDVTIAGSNYTIQIIPKGTQLFIYDSVNGQPNDNPYQLPMVFTRTPYGKGTNDEVGVLMNLLGYSYALQDMRGRYTSEGVYFPMYSDSWNKSTYHPNSSHVLDVTAIGDSHNSNYHEDGKNSIAFILDSLYRVYDLDRDGIAETSDKFYNGSLAMFGASALGNTQYQAAAAYKNNTTVDGLKGIMPIVATLEYYNSTMQNNGVFRRALMQGWIEGQMEDVVNTIPSDMSVQNAIHSIFDYGNISSDSILNLGVDQFTTLEDNNGNTGMYPNSLLRPDMDGSYAPINSTGSSDINGNYNRYSNLSLPIYNLTGWWDIFINGQIDSYNNVVNNNISTVKQNQKLVIGPWTHSTIGSDTVADIVYPSSIFDLKIFGNSESFGATNINGIVEGEVASWLRYLLNYEVGKELGEPKVLIPESSQWQNVGTYDVRVPSEDYYINYSDFLNFLAGHTDLTAMPTEIRQGTTVIPYSLDLPADTANQTPGQAPLNVPATPKIDYASIPNVRYYVPGPVNDGIVQNNSVGNYWASSDIFPLENGIQDKAFYLHSIGSLDTVKPIISEQSLSYIHNPDNPVYTVGGGNLGVPTPQLDRVSAGPMNYADSNFSSYTMNRADVLQFETSSIQDSLTIVGIPKAKIYASSTPNGATSGVTDTDFFVRILDVYPDGREYFVVEGAINARARDYAKTLVNGSENSQVPFTNINIGQIYEYEFNLLPIAYSFGHQHKMKVLISSSNWPRYQSNPNLPIEDGEFFRREPNDGKSYTFNNISMAPRNAQQEIQFSPSEPSQILLPVLTGEYTTISESQLKENIEVAVYPNPTSNYFIVKINNTNESYSCTLTSITNQLLASYEDCIGSKNINIGKLPAGVYNLRVETTGGKRYVEKIVKR